MSQYPTLTSTERAAPASKYLAELGAFAIEFARGGRELYSVFVRTLFYTFRGQYERGAVVQQMYLMGNRSLFFITVTMGFIGMILVLQGGTQAQRVIPDPTVIGSTYLELLYRDLAASIGALMLATRVGAGIAAELGSMVVTEQVDALRMCAADPIDYLIKPRFVAGLIMTTVLLIWSAMVATLTGMGTAFVFFDIHPNVFFDLRLVGFDDLLVGLTKCLAYGAAIPIVSGYCGLSTYGGSEGVGLATTRAVVNSSLAVIMLNFFISGAAFLLFGA